MADWKTRASSIKSAVEDYVGKTVGRSGGSSPTPGTSQRSPREDTDENLDEPYPDTTNLPLTMFNIVNFITSPMISGTPYAVKYIGPFLAGPVFFILAIMLWFSMNLLIRTAKTVDKSNYQEIGREIDGKIGFFIVTFFEFIYYEAVLTILLLHLSLNCTHIAMSYTGQHSLNFFIYIHILITLVFIWPLCLIKRIEKLAKLSLVSFLLLLTSFVLVVYMMLNRDEADFNYNAIMETWTWRPPDSGQCLVVILSGCVLHQCSLTMHITLKNNTVRRWNIALGCSLLINVALMTAFGYLGYATFFQYSQGNIFENYCIGDKLAIATRILISLVIILIYPFVCHFNVKVVERCFKKPMSKKKFILTATIIVIISAGLVFSTKCVGIVQEFHGSLLACPILLIIPPYYYMRTSFSPKLTLNNLSAMILFCAGLVIMIYSIVMIGLDLENTDHLCVHGKESYYCTYIIHTLP